MSSAVMDKLRGLLRRPPVEEAEMDRPTLEWNPVRRVESLARELDRVATRQAELEKRLTPEPTSAIGPAIVTASDLGRIDAALAALQARCADLAAGQTSMAAALQRADDEVAQVDADRDEIVHQLSTLHMAVGQDRARLEEVHVGLRTLRDELSAAAVQWTSSNVDWSHRADELGRRTVARLAPLYLVSLLALIASLAALGIVISRM